MSTSAASEPTPARSIPFFNYPALYEEKAPEIQQVLTDVMKRGAYIMQRDLEQFEANLCKFLNVKHAFGVADGTEALIIGLKAAGVEPGTEVIVPSHTFIASAGAIKFAGCTPVLADCGPDHMVDPESIRSKITSKTSAIMPVQLNGRTCKMDEILAIAKEHNLIVVEDAAQALGSKYKGQNAGTFGSAGTFSFYPAKVLGCFGDGGGIVTNDDSVAERIYQMRDHGRDKSGEIVDWGINSRLDNMQAAILDFKLKTFPSDIKKRRDLATRYHSNLHDLEALHLPQPPNDGDHFDIFQNYEIEADRRDELTAYLQENGVRTLVQWSGKAVHQWEALGFSAEGLDYTEKMFKRCVMLPLNTTLTFDDVDYISNLIRGFYKAS